MNKVLLPFNVCYKLLLSLTVLFNAENGGVPYHKLKNKKLQRNFIFSSRIYISPGDLVSLN